MLVVIVLATLAYWRAGWSLGDAFYMVVSDGSTRSAIVRFTRLTACCYAASPSATIVLAAPA